MGFAFLMLGGLFATMISFPVTLVDPLVMAAILWPLYFLSALLLRFLDPDPVAEFPMWLIAPSVPIGIMVLWFMVVLLMSGDVGVGLALLLVFPISPLGAQWGGRFGAWLRQLGRRNPSDRSVG